MSAAAELKPWVFAALVMVGMLSAAAYQFVGERPRGNTRPVAAAMTDMAAGEIRLTSAEMHALRIEPVLEREFRTERLIEGRIAYDEEGVTPVFSPYGRARVVRLVAHTGDTVRQGDTLFEVESVDLLRAEGELLCKRSDEARLPGRAVNMLGRPGAGSFEPTLWSTLMTTRRAVCTAG